MKIQTDFQNLATRGAARMRGSSMLQRVRRVVRGYFGSSALGFEDHASGAPEPIGHEGGLEDLAQTGEAGGTRPDTVTQSHERPRIELRAYDVAAVRNDYRQLYFPDDAPNLEPIVCSLRENAECHPSNIGADERLCVEILRFTTASMELGAPRVAYEPASAILANALSSCGGYSLVMCELARVAGLPARYLGLFGIPSVGSHALVEVHFDDRWHLFDPTFGVFFYSGTRWDGTGRVLSASDIIASRERPTLIQAVEKPWGRDYPEQRRFAVQPLLDPPTSHVVEYWSEEGRRTLFPVAFGNDAIISIPVEIDLRSQRTFQLGERTGKWQDTWLEYNADRHNGYFFIGGTCPTIFHCVRIKVEAPGRLRVTYIAAPESSGGLGVFPLAGCLLSASEADGLATTFCFFLNSHDPSFLLIAEHNYWIDVAQYTFEVEDNPQPVTVI